MTTPDMTSNEVVSAIETHLGGNVTAEQVRGVLSALSAIRDGDPVGKVVREAETGRIAHRVTYLGVDQWRVTGPDGELYNDMQPTLPGWETIIDPTA